MAEYDTMGMEQEPKKQSKAPAAKPIVKLPPFRPMQATGAPASVGAQAAATGTSALVLAALTAAYKWTEKTKLTRAEFLKKRAAWLSRPASEV